MPDDQEQGVLVLARSMQSKTRHYYWTESAPPRKAAWTRRKPRWIRVYLLTQNPYLGQLNRDFVEFFSKAIDVKMLPLTETSRSSRSSQLPNKAGW